MAPDPPRVLVVEDEALVAKDIQYTLQRLGYAVPTTVRSASEALEVIDGNPIPNLVLMDIGLDGPVDGITAATQITTACGAPVVFITGHLDDETISRAKATNPYGYLIKPFDERELRSTVEVALARHNAEKTVRESASRFSSTLRSMADGVIATDLAGRITYINPVAESITSWESGHAIGRNLSDVFRISHPTGETADPAPMAIDPGTPADAIAAGGRPIMLATRTGELVPIEDNTAPIMDEDGALNGLVVVFRKRRDTSTSTEEAHPSWANLVGIVEGIGEPLFAVDASWNLTYVNNRAAAYFGKRRQNLIGADFWSEVPTAIHSKHHADFYGALLRKEPRTFEIHHESRKSWFDVHAYPFGDGLLVLFRDITTRKAAEEHRAKVEKLESLGLLARGFAHEFNNLLTVLLGNISLAAMRLPEGNPARGEIDTAKSATIQAQNLVQQLLTFAKGGTPIKRPTRPSELIAETLREHPHVEHIDYSVTTPVDLPPIHIDPDQIKRLITNLVRNAEQALPPEGGNIRITTYLTEEATSVQAPDIPCERELVIVVMDNGHGVKPDDLQFVFEPYFSTRAKDNATGLGLTVCESIARAHDGSLTIDSTEDAGTSITLRIPYTGDPTTPSKTDGEDDASKDSFEPVRQKRILILEDEPLIRELAITGLKSRGFQVDTTSDGADTVSRFREAYHAGHPYDLLILDLTIPGGTGGARTMEQILQIDPNITAVVSSGYSDHPAMSRPADFGFKAVLPKPYDPKALADLASHLLS
ncbi:MAG: response regulator [Verrucomicrobiales bacterium]|nr:response regulator [Verrucomicrobiales bacterium]